MIFRNYDKYGIIILQTAEVVRECSLTFAAFVRARQQSKIPGYPKMREGKRNHDLKQVL